MKDSYGRKIDYLRISVTDRCNLRCIYCMPQEGLLLTTHEELLTFDEIVRVCTIMADMGLKKIKLTGGEPLLRRNLKTLIYQLKQIPQIESVTLTTNGVSLEQHMEQLYEAGIDAINVSLDTLNPQVYREITRGGNLEAVKRGIEKALEFPQVDLKINCVPISMEKQHILELLEYAKSSRIHVRFIEMMPIGLGKQFQCLTEAEILQQIETHYGAVRDYKERIGNGPCHYYEIDGFVGKIGFISAISHKFCDRCNRVRLTSTGYLKTCLQYETGGDLKALLRSGADDSVVAERLARLIWDKPDGHQFLTKDVQHETVLGMSQIGG